MSEYERHIEPAGKRFLTGHPVFDQIVDINLGTSILMLDETFSEANKLLNILFKTYGVSMIDRHYEVVPYSSPAMGEHVLSVGDQPLSDTSIAVNDLRRRYRNIPFIHTALPDMIIKNDPDDILRLLMAWQKSIREAGTVEFYILPKGTFQDLERKILSVVDGGIGIRVDQTEGRFRAYLKPIRCCRPEFHLKEFQYMINNGRILIQWEDRFTDELVSYDLEEIRSRVEDYKKNLRFLKVIPGGKTDPQVSVYDYWMLSQLQGKLLSEINEVFPEDFDQMLRKIAAWQIADVLRVVQTTEPWKSTYPKSPKVSRRTQLALRIPTWLTKRIFRLMIGRPRTMPLDAFLYNRKATLAFIDMLLSKLDLKEDDYTERLLEMQKRFYEVGSRETAIKHSKLLGENISLQVDTRYLPKVLELTFNTTYQINPRITKVSEKEYLLEFHECYECSEIKYSKPVCSPIEGIVEGICGVIFKTGARCREIECKALGDEACVFRIEFG
ncbi:MAG: V4R domain-containing protein [Nitrososphaerales archaeon]